jgi:C4-dicarboxylate-specific signal transduction histidine kinase
LLAGVTRTYLATKAPYRDERGEIVGTIGISHDISDRKRAEAERRDLVDRLRQAQKMEVVGRLAGGVAHDFNNLLTVITGFTDLVLADFPPGGHNATLLGEVRKAADRAASLTGQLLAFGRRPMIQPRVLELNAVVTGGETMSGASSARTSCWRRGWGLTRGRSGPTRAS